MTPVPWEVTSFTGIHTQPAKVENGEHYASDIRNLRIDGDGWLRLRSDAVAVGPDVSEGVTGIASTPRHFFILRNNGNVYVRDHDDTDTETQIEGILSGLEGRLSVVDFNTFVILTSEGDDQGWWVDMREDNDNYLQAYTLGFNAPTDGDSSLVVTDPSGIVDDLRIRYFYKITYSRQFTVEEGVEELDLFNGVESEASPAITVELRRNLGGTTFIRLEDFLYPVGGQLTHINIYRTDALGADNEVEEDDSEKYQYRKVASIPFDSDTFTDFGDSYSVTPSDVLTVAYTWEDGELLRLDNQRLPAEAKSLTEYNGLIFAPAGDRLIYSDIRDGTLTQWAFPKVNEIRVEGRVDFASELREVLLFGSRDGLWRLTGTDEYDFATGQLGSIGPIDGYAWSKTVDGLAFVGEGGLFVCDTAQVLKASDIALDDFFDNKTVIRGSVIYFKTNDILFSVSFQGRNELKAKFDVSMLPAGYANLSENQENIINISDAITSLGAPATMTISTEEVTDTDNAISAVGVSTSGNAGDGAASVTVTPNASNGVDALYLHLTAADITGGNKMTDIRIRLEQPDGFASVDYQFLLQDGRWLRWDLDFIQSASLIEDGEATLVLVADGTGQTKEIKWNDLDTAVDIEWHWESQPLDGVQPGLANRKKRFRELRFNGEADNDMTLEVWPDESDDAIEVATDITARPDDLLDVRVPINRRGRRMRFKLSGTGPVKVQGLRLEMLT